jgi:hypothetical protein
MPEYLLAFKEKQLIGRFRGRQVPLACLEADCHCGTTV